MHYNQDGHIITVERFHEHQRFDIQQEWKAMLSKTPHSDEIRHKNWYENEKSSQIEYDVHKYDSVTVVKEYTSTGHPVKIYSEYKEGEQTYFEQVSPQKIKFEKLIEEVKSWNWFQVKNEGDKDKHDSKNCEDTSAGHQSFEDRVHEMKDAVMKKFHANPDHNVDHQTLESDSNVLILSEHPHIDALDEALDPVLLGVMLASKVLSRKIPKQAKYWGYLSFTVPIVTLDPILFATLMASKQIAKLPSYVKLAIAGSAIAVAPFAHGVVLHGLVIGVTRIAINQIIIHGCCKLYDFGKEVHKKQKEKRLLNQAILDALERNEGM
jgi:hypothetical protein